MRVHAVVAQLEQPVRLVEKNGHPCSFVAGLLHVDVPNTEALYALVINKLRERPELAVDTFVAYEHVPNYIIPPLEHTENPTRRAPARKATHSIAAGDVRASAPVISPPAA